MADRDDKSLRHFETRTAQLKTTNLRPLKNVPVGPMVGATEYQQDFQDVTDRHLNWKYMGTSQKMDKIDHFAHRRNVVNSMSQKL